MSSLPSVGCGLDCVACGGDDAGMVGALAAPASARAGAMVGTGLGTGKDSSTGSVCANKGTCARVVGGGGARRGRCADGGARGGAADPVRGAGRAGPLRDCDGVLVGLPATVVPAIGAWADGDGVAGTAHEGGRVGSVGASASIRVAAGGPADATAADAAGANRTAMSGTSSLRSFQGARAPGMPIPGVSNCTSSRQACSNNEISSAVRSEIVARRRRRRHRGRDRWGGRRCVAARAGIVSADLSGFRWGALRRCRCPSMRRRLQQARHCRANESLFRRSDAASMQRRDSTRRPVSHRATCLVTTSVSGAPMLWFAVHDAMARPSGIGPRGCVTIEWPSSAALQGQVCRCTHAPSVRSKDILLSPPLRTQPADTVELRVQSIEAGATP
jgi:hypothetical protein